MRIHGHDAGSRPSHDAGHTAGGEPSSLREFVVDEREALADFVTSVVRFGFVAKRLLDSRTFASLAAAAPGVKDLVTLAAVADIAAGKRGEEFDLLVIDAPASGHSLPLLTAPTQVAELIPFGPVATAARRVNEMVYDPCLFSCVVVAIAEELAATEALDLWRSLRSAGIETSAILVNRLLNESLTDGQRAWLAKKRVSPDALYYDANSMRQRILIERLEEESGPALKLPEYRGKTAAAESAEIAEILSCLGKSLNLDYS